MLNVRKITGGKFIFSAAAEISEVRNLKRKQSSLDATQFGIHRAMAGSYVKNEVNQEEKLSESWLKLQKLFSL